MRPLNGHTQREEREETFERELKRSVRNLSRQIAQLTQAVSEIENFQAGNSSGFPPSPRQYLEEFEGIENEVEKSYFFAQHKEIIETGIKARDWQRLKDRTMKFNPFLRKPPKGSLTSQYEALARTDAEAGQRFYRANEDGIKREVSEFQQKAIDSRWAHERAEATS
jgi:hypothetical protein